MKGKKISRVVAIVMVVMMLVSAVPMTAFASIANWAENNVVYNGSTFGTDGYYNVISKKDYTLVPGAATETEMVLNNATGNRRQVIHVMEIDPSNPDVSIIPGYYGIDKFAADPTNTAYHKAAGVTTMAAYYENTLGYNVVGAMNTALAYDCNAPYSYLVYNGEVLVDANNGVNNFHTGGCQTMLCVYKDAESGECSCELRTSAQGLRGDEWQAIGANFEMVVNDGKLVTNTVSRSGDDAARSMVGVKEDGTLVLVMNDGRGANNSKGFTSSEEGECMLALGCKWAFNCDGGGSSSFVTRRVGEEDLTMRCVPCDGAERPTLNSVLVVSNVAPTGILDTVNIESDYDILAPKTTYSFGTKAIDTHGYAMDMPVDVTWALSDETFGTIENGTFISGGKLGKVTVQVISNGIVFGEKEIEIANPTTFSLTDKSTVIPYSTAEKPRTTVLPIIAKIGEANVFYDTAAIKVESSVAEAGTLNGFEFTATTDESVSGTKLTLTYVPTGAVLTYDIAFGKGSEVIWDFEDGELHGFLGQEDAEKWQTENGTHPFENLYAGGNISTCISEKTFVATKENGGQVHNGNCSVGLTIDMTQVDFNGWVYANIYNVEGVKVLRDTASGNNAITFGMWVYIPYGFRTEENSGSMAIRFDFMAGADKDHLTRTNFNGMYKGKTVNSLTEDDIPENRWIYVTTSLSGYNYVRTENPYDGSSAEGYSPDLARMYVKPSVSQKLTYYFDDFTLDYSSAVDDRVPPEITNPQYATSDTNFAFDNGVEITDVSAAYTTTVTDDNSGIDPTTAAIYIDGNKVSSTQVVNNKMFCDAVALGVGTHKVKFEIADNLGNYTTLTRTIVSKAEDHHMWYRTRIELSGHNDSGKTPVPGSLYYIDITSNYSDAGVTADFTLALNTANTWELDNMIKGAGVEVEYTVNPCNPNEVSFSMTSPTAKGTLLSIPVRVYNPLLTNGSSDGAPVAVSGKSFKAPLSVEMTSCTVFGSYGNYEKYSVAEFDAVRTITRHDHTAYAIEDKPATCTETGCTGRTYCDVCQSVVDWGTTVPATGHSYKLVENKFVCDCGDVYSGTGLFEMDGKTYYAIGGNLVSGWQDIDGEQYYFDKTTFEGINGTRTSNEVCQTGAHFTYSFTNGKLDSGAWVKTSAGTRYYYGNSYVYRCQRIIDGKQYAFAANGIRYEGTCVIQWNPGMAPQLYEYTDEGVYVGELYVNGVYTVSNGDTYYFENGVPKYAGLVYDGEYYYYFDGVTLKAAKNCKVTPSKLNGLLPYKEYEFDEYGHLVFNYKNGLIKDDDGNIRYYVNDKATYAGLVQDADGNYYYISGSTLTAVKGRSVYITFTNGLMPAGMYEFDADGKMVIELPKQGVVKDDDGNIRYYVDGKATYAGLVQDANEDYYYISGSTLTAVKGRSVYITFTNGLKPAGMYEFDEDGKMILPKHGVVKDDDGNIRYYVDGKATYAGLVQDKDGSYYYISGSTLTAVKGRSVYITFTNNLMPAGMYAFDTDGKMITK